TQSRDRGGRSSGTGCCLGGGIPCPVCRREGEREAGEEGAVDRVLEGLGLRHVAAVAGQHVADARDDARLIVAVQGHDEGGGGSRSGGGLGSRGHADIQALALRRRPVGPERGGWTRLTPGFPRGVILRTPPGPKGSKGK